MLHLFQENKSYGIETIVLILCLQCSGQGGGFVSCSPKYIIKKKLILCLHVAVHHILSKKGYSELQWATILGLISYIELHR